MLWRTSSLSTSVLGVIGSYVERHFSVYDIDSIVFDILNLLACKKRSLFALSNHGSTYTFLDFIFYYSSSKDLSSNAEYSSPF